MNINGVNAKPSVVFKALSSPMGSGVGLLEKVLSFARRRLGPTVLPSTQGLFSSPGTPEADIEAAVAQLAAKKQEWFDLPLKDKASLCRECVQTLRSVAHEGARLGSIAKGVYGQGAGEELLGWFAIVQGMQEYAESLASEGRAAVEGVRARRTLDGKEQHAVEVFPRGLIALFFPGCTAELWVEPGRPATQGEALRARHIPESAFSSSPPTPLRPHVSLVLGAGNQTIVPTLDVAHKMFVEQAVVVLKMNPVNEYLGPILEKGFAPLVQRGYLSIVYGGPTQGELLCRHPLIESIHLTGSAATFDAIVFGPGADKTKGPRLNKRVDGELGCVTPYIISPGGTWSKSDLDYHAGQVVVGLAQNSAHNCLAAEIVLTCRQWPQREAFVAALRRKLAATRTRVGWYPGTAAKRAAFRARFPDAEELPSQEQIKDGTEPWLLQAGLDASAADTNTENWCGVLQEVALDVPGAESDPALFLRAAADYCNGRVWGTLSCTLIAHPSVPPAAVEEAAERLKYGSVVINAPAFFGCAVTAATWGAYPGNPLADIGSGNCTVHNTLMIDRPEKSVVRAPFRMPNRSIWGPDYANMDGVASALIDFAATDNKLLALNFVAAAALRG